MPDLATRYGVLSVPDMPDDVIVGFLQRYGEWAWDETCFIAGNLRDGARIADIGAFLGTFGLGLARLRRLGLACFVEPNPVLAPLLRDNVQRNCDAESAVIAAAVAPIGSELERAFYEEGNLGSLSYVDRPRARGTRTLGGPTETIDLASLRRRCGEFDLIKIDVEGLETDILQGELASLIAAKTDLWIEANEDLETIGLGTMLLEAGMQVHYFAWSSFNPDNFRHDSTPIYAFAYEAGLYASVGDPPVLDDALKAHQPILKRIDNRDDLVEALWVTPRWGMADWCGRPLPEVVALAGRELRGEARANFPNPAAAFAPSDAPLIALRARLRSTDEALARAEALAIERLAELHRLDAQLGTAASLALERLTAIRVERDRVQERDARIALLEETLQAALHTLRAMESHPLWRAADGARLFLSRHPRLKAGLRAIARAARVMDEPRSRNRDQA